MQGTAAVHGEPLGADDVRATKRFYGWPEDAQFHVPDQVYGHLADGVGARGRRARDEWMTTFERYRAAHPQLAEQLYRMQHRTLPDGWDAEDRRASLDRPVCHVM